MSEREREIEGEGGREREREGEREREKEREGERERETWTTSQCRSSRLAMHLCSVRHATCARAHTRARACGFL